MHQRETIKIELEESDQAPVVEGTSVSRCVNDLGSSDTKDSLLRNLETSLRQLKIPLTCVKSETSELVQEKNDFRDECNRLQQDNNNLRTQVDKSNVQLRNAEERVRALETELEDERRNAQIFQGTDNEIVAERRRADGLAADITRLQDLLNEARRDLENSATDIGRLKSDLIASRSTERASFAMAKPVRDKAPWLAEALRSRYVDPQPRYAMTAGGPSRAEHPYFDSPCSFSGFIDLNGEVAWIKVSFVRQHPRDLVKHG